MSTSPNPSLVTMGETLASLTNEKAQPLRHASHLSLAIGGAESNVAIGAARLGIQTAWIGRIGDDELGRLIINKLTGEGLHVAATTDPTRPTALMLKSRRTSGLMNVDYYRKHSAGSSLSLGDIDADLIRNARVFHVSAITPALSASARDAVHYAIDLAKEAGTKVSIDLNYRAALWSKEEAREDFRYLAASADILFSTLDEARIAVPGETPEEVAGELAALGAKKIIIKSGSKGAAFFEAGHQTQVDTFPVLAIDDIGAGDAFAAGFLACSLLDGESEDCLRWGAALGAWAVSTNGDWEGLPSQAELASFLTADKSTETVAR
jgi:2-dehydro-3-deoxygluconokinase